MNPETWTNLLFTYGPFAILVFLVVVIKLLSSAWKQSDKNNQQEQTFFRRLYGLTWVVIIGAAICCIFAWWQINLSRRPQITGRVEHLPKKERLSTSFGDLYLRKSSETENHSDYDLMLINKDYKQWTEGEKVKFTIQAASASDTKKEDDLYEYELPIRSDFYRTGMVLKRRPGKLILAHNNQETELAGELLPGNALPSSPSVAMVEPTWSLIPTANAQTQVQTQQAFSSADISAGLESPDAIVRRKTRYILSLQDQNVALPWINSVLNDTKSSYRMRLGVLVALNNMANLPVQALLPETIAAIQNTINDSDDALRNEALELANRYHLIPVTVYEHENLKGGFQVFGPGRYPRLGSLPNDSASSLSVAKGFSVRLCEDEVEGKGSGLCQTFGAGEHNLGWGPKSVGDKVSFIEVSRN